MKVAAFYPASPFAAWSVARGVPRVLQRMGIETLDCGLPPGREFNSQQFDALKARMPKLEQLAEQDAILVFGLEHVVYALDLLYGAYMWQRELTVPKAAWYHESFFREDGSFDFDPLRLWAREHFFPAAQDAEFFNQPHFADGHAHWLPFGVDTEVFRPESDPKLYDIAFIGLAYGKRQAYLKRLQPHLRDVELICGPVRVCDLSGPRVEDEVNLLAENYRRIKVFFNLPSLSQLLVTKVLEVMACGTFLMTPALDGNPEDKNSPAHNCGVFEQKKHLVYYRETNFPYINQQLREWSQEKESEREEIARAGCEEVRAKHRLELKLEAMLSKLGAKVEVQ